MPKSRDAFRTISEVADWLETPAHVLRFWESKFSQVKPVKRAGGRRYYRPADMELLSGIKRLLHDDGMTIKGVQKVLREQGVRHVASLASLPVDPETEDQPPVIEDAPYVEVDMDEAEVVAFPGEAVMQQAKAASQEADHPAEGSPLPDDPAADPQPEPEPEVAEARAEELVEEPVEVSAPAPSLSEDFDPESVGEDFSTLPENAPAANPKDRESPNPEPMATEPKEMDPTNVPPDDVDPIAAPEATEPVGQMSVKHDTGDRHGSSQLPFDFVPEDDVDGEVIDLDDAEEAPAPESEPVIPAPEEAARPAIPLQDFGAPEPQSEAPKPQHPAVGPLGHIAGIATLDAKQRAALAAQMPALVAFRDRLAAPLN
ncbi:MerR family transcriptional regulator [Mameliella sediminis]|uniref:MerR family transcriptional regulator n=1 Tax=Mameliella sediminis TaxID=2836866 RepID=UPI001FE5F6CA|nr:MerR family transcriptional regulator [Mameliella sediminis]